jgi:hypothetical protein
MSANENNGGANVMSNGFINGGRNGVNVWLAANHQSA